MVKRTKQWEHLQNKKRTQSSDSDRLTQLHDIFSQNKLAVFSNVTLNNDKFIHQKRLPDLLWKDGHIQIPIEDDGPIHGNNDELTESKQTRERNDDYTTAGFPFIVINREELKAENIDLETFVKCSRILLSPIIRSMNRIVRYHNGANL